MLRRGEGVDGDRPRAVRALELPGRADHELRGERLGPGDGLGPREVHVEGVLGTFERRASGGSVVDGERVHREGQARSRKVRRSCKGNIDAISPRIIGNGGTDEVQSRTGTDRRPSGENVHLQAVCVVGACE